MKLIITQNGNSVKATIEGRLDTVTAPGLEKELSPYFSEQGVELTLDCAAMDYISSAGLRVILLTHKSITAKGGTFKLKNLNKEVLSVFDMTGFSKILTIE